MQEPMRHDVQTEELKDLFDLMKPVFEILDRKENRLFTHLEIGSREVVLSTAKKTFQTMHQEAILSKTSYTKEQVTAYHQLIGAVEQYAIASDPRFDGDSKKKRELLNKSSQFIDKAVETIFSVPEGKADSPNALPPKGKTTLKKWLKTPEKRDYLVYFNPIKENMRAIEQKLDGTSGAELNSDDKQYLARFLANDVNFFIEPPEKVNELIISLPEKDPFERYNELTKEAVSAANNSEKLKVEVKKLEQDQGSDLSSSLEAKEKELRAAEVAYSAAMQDRNAASPGIAGFESEFDLYQALRALDKGEKKRPEYGKTKIYKKSGYQRIGSKLGVSNSLKNSTSKRTLALRVKLIRYARAVQDDPVSTTFQKRTAKQLEKLATESYKRIYPEAHRMHDLTHADLDGALQEAISSDAAAATAAAAAAGAAVDPDPDARAAAAAAAADSDPGSDAGAAATATAAATAAATADPAAAAGSATDLERRQPPLQDRHPASSGSQSLRDSPGLRD